MKKEKWIDSYLSCTKCGTHSLCQEHGRQLVEEMKEYLKAKRSSRKVICITEKNCPC